MRKKQHKERATSVALGSVHLRWRVLLGSLFISSLAFAQGMGGGGGMGGSSSNDYIQCTNTSGVEIGCLVDGKVKNSNHNDDKYTSSTDGFSVDKYVSGSSNEVIAYTENRPVTLVENVPWATAADTVDVDFADEMLFDVTIWVVYAPNGDFAAQETKILNDVLTTSTYFQAERLGVDFGNVTIIDATNDPDASNYYAFTCSLQNGIKTDIGNVAGEINIYYTQTVDGGSARGQACQVGSDFVAMAAFAGNELLSHEIGHDFQLYHIDGLTTYFNQTNIMHSASNSRQYLTEGQTFRAHLQSGSAINFLYNARPGQSTRNCGSTSTNPTNTCPEIQRRIWSDGTYPAN